MKWYGNLEDLQDVFEINRFEIDGLQPTNLAERFRIKDAQFSLFRTGKLVVQGRGADYMRTVTKRILKDDERFKEEE
jgi:hypothetical protein